MTAEVVTVMRWYAQDEVNQEDSEQNEVDGMKKGGSSSVLLRVISRLSHKIVSKNLLETPKMRVTSWRQPNRENKSYIRTKVTLNDVESCVTIDKHARILAQLLQTYHHITELIRCLTDRSTYLFTPPNIARIQVRKQFLSNVSVITHYA